jgi:hypothetical protein
MSYYSHIRIEAKKIALDRLHPVAEEGKSASGQRDADFPLLSELRTKANQLGIAADAALELVLTYERNKSSRKIARRGNLHDHKQ